MIIKSGEIAIKTNPDKALISKLSKSKNKKVVGSLIIKYCDSDSLSLCISVSKKISKLATDRNYIKRYIRSAFLQYCIMKKITNIAFYIVVTNKKMPKNLEAILAAELNF